MNKISLDAVAREQLKEAATAGNGPSAEKVCGGHQRH
jgi:hypothetical protein